MDLKTTQSILLSQTEFELTIIRSKKRRRSVALRVKSPTQLIVNAPHKTSLKFIEDFIYERSRWILARLFELQTTEGKPIGHQYIDGEMFYVLGQQYPLRIIEHNVRKTKCELTDHYLTIYIKSKLDKQNIIKHVTQWYRKQALETVTERMEFWCKQLNVRFNKLFITNTKSRWGSCNSKNDIRINWRVMMTPMSLVDYVIVHELCHVVHKNHSARFWNLVSSVMPDHKQRRKELRKLAALF